VIEWSDEWQATDDLAEPAAPPQDSTPTDQPSAAQALPAAFPSTRGEELQRVKGLKLLGVLCEVTLLRGSGGGDYQAASDGCRLVVSSSVGQRDVLLLHRCDWQWLRPRGLNAGALPGLRWLSKKQRKTLVKGLVARLDT
jgi:hypothetical protein